MSFINSSKYFDPLIAKVPQEILDQPINYEEETPNGYLEYVIAFLVYRPMVIREKTLIGLNPPA